MPVQILPNGIGELLGDPLVTGKPLYTGNQIYYVSSIDGSDSYDGKRKSFPFATLVHAISAAAAGDMIVCLDGHTESPTVLTTIALASLTIVGSGQSNGKPTVKINSNAATSVGLFVVNASGIQIRNIYFPPPKQANFASRIKVTANDFRCIGCYFEQASDASEAGGVAVEIGTAASFPRLDNCTFITDPPPGTLENIGDLPAAGLAVSGSGLSGVEMYGCVFSGRYSGAAVDFANAVTRVRFERTAFLNGADAILGASTQVYLNLTPSSQDALINWSVV